jgi:hypothetical protein
VFAFGIEGASPELVNGIAKAGEGKGTEKKQKIQNATNYFT